MEPHKSAFLKSHGLDKNDEIVDCDPIKMTVTFADGTSRQAVDVYTRVMGYHSRKAQFNLGKQQEHKDRKMFRECPAGQVIQKTN